MPGAGVIASFDIEGHTDWSVVVTTLRVAEHTTLRDIAVRTFARQRSQQPAASIRTQRTGRFGDRLTYLREVHVPHDGNDLAQLHVLFMLPLGSGALADVISVVATCPDGQLESLGPPVVDLVASFVSQSP